MIEVPLRLWNRPHWELKGRWDSALFFRHLLELLPTPTTLFVEGTSIAREVGDFLRSAAEPGDYLPARQTLWPQPKQYRLRCDSSTLVALADLAERHAEPELTDHLFVYDGSTVLLEFPDAFCRDSPAYFSAEIDEPRIRRFAAALGLDVTSARPARER